MKQNMAGMEALSLIFRRQMFQTGEGKGGLNADAPQLPSENQVRRP